MEFETFEDKSRAINADTGVNKRLADMIYKWRLSGMKLAVGKPEYKTIIESKLVGILLLVWLYFLDNLRVIVAATSFREYHARTMQL
jgi:hypothetical protein